MVDIACAQRCRLIHASGKSISDDITTLAETHEDDIATAAVGIALNQADQSVDAISD